MKIKLFDNNKNSGLFIEKKTFPRNAIIFKHNISNVYEVFINEIQPEFTSFHELTFSLLATRSSILRIIRSIPSKIGDLAFETAK